jgi:hypothetical protein
MPVWPYRDIRAKVISIPAFGERLDRRKLPSDQVANTFLRVSAAFEFI